MARSSGNRNDPNTTKVVREFKKAITVKVSGIKAFSILICFGQALKALMNWRGSELTSTSDTNTFSSLARNLIG